MHELPAELGGESVFGGTNWTQVFLNKAESPCLGGFGESPVGFARDSLFAD